MQEGFTEASFRNFCARPEHRKALENEQNKQLTQQLKLQQQHEAIAFRSKVVDADPAVLRSIAPCLRSPALRQFVKSFTHESQFTDWADNPRVIAMLQQALRLLQHGHITEQELEHALVSQMKMNSSKPGVAEVNEPDLERRYDSAELVAVLNRHLTLRRQGNEHYKMKHFTEALDHYNKAKRLLLNIKASRDEDQQEIQRNQVAVELNIAAVHVSQQHYGAAIRSCTTALSIDGNNTKALMRRAKAHKGRHNLEEATHDLSHIVRMDPANLEAHALLHEVRDAMYKATKHSTAIGGLYAQQHLQDQST